MPTWGSQWVSKGTSLGVPRAELPSSALPLAGSPVAWPSSFPSWTPVYPGFPIGVSKHQRCACVCVCECVSECDRQLGGRRAHPGAVSVHVQNPGSPPRKPLPTFCIHSRGSGYPRPPPPAQSGPTLPSCQARPPPGACSGDDPAGHRPTGVKRERAPGVSHLPVRLPPWPQPDPFAPGF